MCTTDCLHNNFLDSAYKYSTGARMKHLRPSLEDRDGRPRHNAAIHLRLPLHLPASGSFLLHDFFLEGREGRPRHKAAIHLRLPLHLPASGSFLRHDFFRKVAMAALATKLPSTFVYHCTSPLVAAFCSMIFFGRSRWPPSPQSCHPPSSTTAPPR